MKNLFYARHGESQIVANDMWGNQPGSDSDLGLTEKGREQALTSAKAAHKNKVKFDLIICSPSLRTRQTAAIIAKEVGYPIEDIEYSDLFLEVQVGELEGKPFSEFIKNYTFADLGLFEGAEDIEQLQKRAEKAFAYVKSKSEANILVVSHSAFGRAFRRVINRLPHTDEFENNTPLPLGEIQELL